MEDVSRTDMEQETRQPTRGRRCSKLLVRTGGCESFLDLYDIPFFGVGR